MKIAGRFTRFNLLTDNYLLRGARCAVFAAAVSCGGAAQPSPEQTPAPAPPTIPLPTAGLAGQRVSLYPLTLVAAEDSLHWEALVRDRRGTLWRADSVIGELLAARAPEVGWIAPAELRRSARRAIGIASDPDQMGTSILRADGIDQVPDPLRTQLRSLTALAGGRFAVVPAALVYKRGLVPRGQAGRSVPRAHGGATEATAELTIVMVDVRMGRVVWRTIARGDGPDAWSALTTAVKALTPGLP